MRDNDIDAVLSFHLPRLTMTIVGSPRWGPSRLGEIIRSTRILLADSGRYALDIVLPPRCLACGEIVDRQGGVCAVCWRALTFLTPPWCTCCGRPFPHAVDLDDDGEMLCPDCLIDPPWYDQARAVLVYDDGSRGMILGFKHGDRTFAAPAFAAWMARAGAALLADCDLVVPVPLHRWRLFRRRYNQAALLAIAIGNSTKVPVVPDLLIRQRATDSQGHLGRAARYLNVAGAFAVSPRRQAAIAGRRILLIDDVLTSGATVTECARVLLAAGAARIDVLALARVVKAG